ncbi:MAG: SDR family NAD(P)-dependent oxidoreductase [Nitrospinota bacterium]|nr:SDR family NAD(P)-dependent oxidoreductase [Nitrospinota bacterium]
MGKLDGKIALVTGAGQGIGKSIAKALSEDGARTVLASRNLNNLKVTASEIGSSSLVVQTDVSDEISVRNLIGKVSSELGSVDILVNNSGVAGPTKPCEDVTLEEWEDCFSVNMKGMFLVTKYVIPLMKEKRYGRIINVSSMSGKRPLPNRTPYTSSKMAVIGFTRTLAFELGEFGITVNSICPGATAGPRIDSVIQNMSESFQITFEEAKKTFTDPSALKTLVTPEDHAALCVFLASEDSVRMTGQDINLTGGLIWY